MPKARFKFKLPGGPATLSTEYPDEEFRILAALPTGEGLLVVFEARTSDNPAVLRSLDESSWLPSYDVLHADEQTVLVQYLLPFIPRRFAQSWLRGTYCDFHSSFETGG